MSEHEQPDRDEEAPVALQDLEVSEDEGESVKGGFFGDDNGLG